jgi:hypothetical protein
VKVKTPTRRAVGHTRPQPPKSQGRAEGHEKEPNGPKPAETPKPVKTPKPEAPQAGNANGNGQK